MSIFDQIREEFIGDWVSVRDKKGNRVIVKVLRVDISCTESHTRARLTVDSSEEVCEPFYELFTSEYNPLESDLLPAFYSIAEYNKYYGLCEHVRFTEVK